MNVMTFQPFGQVEYRIMSALNEYMVLDCMVDYDNQVAIWKWHQGPCQRWHLQKVQNNKFKFINALNSKVMLAPGIGSNGGFDIKCRISSKIEQQIWQIIPVQEEQFKQKFAFVLKSSSGKVMDVYDGKAKNGQRIIEWEEKTIGKLKQRLNQIWILQPVSFIPERKATYKIFTALDYELVMDASRDPNHLNEIILCYSHKNENQKFQIQYYHGKYLIINKDQGFSLQIHQNSSQNQAFAVVGPMKKEPCELWDIVPCRKMELNAKGAFYLRSYCGKFLDISNGLATDRAKVIQWDYNGNKNQLWYIQKI